MAVLVCPSCQRSNPPGSRFCGGCGTALPVVCAACAHANPPGGSFCNACGRRLGGAPAPGLDAAAPRAYTPAHLAERILRTRSALEGERKHVTVLFADLAGSTVLAVRLGPEAMHEVMDRCFQVVLEQVHRFEGTVNQFLGDGVMALFGAPIALEDAPRRAVRAALGIQRGLQPLGDEVRARFGGELRMRIGIHSGPVVVGRIGDDLRMDYTAVGDTTHLASRLQDLATPGKVLVSEATEHLVSGFFELDDLGAVGIRGLGAPVHAFEVRAERPVAGRIDVEAASGLTPLAGRDGELAELRRAFESAREGRGRAVFLVGEAGIGKSRLLHELRRGAAVPPHAWFEGHCASYARHTPFHAIADGLRRGLGIDEHDDDTAARAKLDARERAAGGELAWTLPHLAQVLSLPVDDPELERLDPLSRRSETFRALRAQLLRAAEREAVVLVIEDLHWIDKASEEFLGFLMDSVPTLRLLLVLTHRPGYQHPFGDRSFQLRLALQSLSERDMARMAGAVLAARDLPQELERLIARKAEGNPLFVEEVTRSLLEDGSLRRVEGRIELARRLDDLSVPDRIQDVLMARLDRLPDAPKRALQIASVIGREFALRLLERICDAGEHLEPLVAELRALELIHQKTLHPELAYMFKHALTHDVAYESVLAGRRKALHRLVGAAIEELYRDRLVEQWEALAHHFAAGEDWEKAFLYHERAAGKAAAAYANHAAIEHCRAALEIAGRLGERVPADARRALEERMGECFWCVSDFRASGDAFLRAVDLAAEPLPRALDLGRAAYSYEWGHEYELAEKCLDDALAFSRASGVAVGEAMALLGRGFLRAVQGDLEQAEALGARAADAARGHPEVHALACLLDGEFAEWRGDWTRTVAKEREALELASKARQPKYAIQAGWFLAKAWGCRGEYQLALDALGEALELSERVDAPAARTRILNTLGWLHAELGSLESAEELNRLSTALARELVAGGLVPGAPELHGNASINLACNHIGEGELGAAAELLAPIREELARPGDPWMRWRYGLHLLDAEARLALARGDPEAALAAAEGELSGARRHRARKLELRALELRGRVRLVMDLRDEAGFDLRAALALAEELGHPPVRWRAHSLLAELARRDGDAGRAGAEAAQVQAIVGSLAGGLREEPMRRRFRALGQRLAADPLGAWR